MSYQFEKGQVLKAEQLNHIVSATGLSDYSEFSEAVAYNAGDKVFYNGKSYKFTANHAAGTWLGSDVEEWSDRKEIRNNVLNNYISKKGRTTKRWEKFMDFDLIEGYEYVITVITGDQYIYLKDENFVEGSDSGTTLCNLSVNEAPSRTFKYKALQTGKGIIAVYTFQENLEIHVQRLANGKDIYFNTDKRPTEGSANFVNSDGIAKFIKEEKAKDIPYLWSFHQLEPQIGHLDGSGDNIVDWSESKHVVIKVSPSNKIQITPSALGYCAISFVKDYQYNSQLPYVLDMAEGQTLINVPSSGGEYTVPDDAQYVIVRHSNSKGQIVLPSTMMINGIYDLAKDLPSNIYDSVNGVASYSQKTSIKVEDVIVHSMGAQGMCAIDDILCTCNVGRIYVKDEGDSLIGTKEKLLGVNIHANDVDYCKFTDTLISSCIPADNLPMAIYLLPNAKEKLYSDIALTKDDWIIITMPDELNSSYMMVSSCWGERSDVVYAILIDKEKDYTNTNKRLIKIELGQTEAGYDGTYTIVENKEWPYVIEVQGSKYCNGKLYVGTDSYINTGKILHASVTVIDIETMQTIEYVEYANASEKEHKTEGEGLAFIGSKLYHNVANHTTSVKSIRVFDRFNL